ncbi:MAG: protein-glutamate O-methyltransferase CheR [Deltaproteobacteria bacterium]|jgi:chemotaxis protein methyltransferase CheR|nr:protein-glutamate O-methyltransferase CheR [Deltaproteobacteria bacterium]
MDPNNIKNIEIDLFLEALLLRHGYDFKNYARASIKRRIIKLLNDTEHQKISEMIPDLLYHESFFQKCIYNFSITVTEMFRNPSFHKSVRKNIIPYLKTFPFIKIWHAGCASGEEVYSFAILLKEEGLLDRSTIYATDFNDLAIEEARKGIYSLKDFKLYIENYKKAGGKRSLSDYCHCQYDSVIIDKPIKESVTFANHNLVTDQVFGEMNLIVCRNVLIYFDQILQKRALDLFSQSLRPNGFLALGDKESLRFSGIEDDYKKIDEKWKIYQKTT